jgi:hypothetical protein
MPAPLITFSVCVDTTHEVSELVRELVRVHNFIQGLAAFTKTTWVEDVQSRPNKEHKRIDVATSIGELKTVLTLAKEFKITGATIRVDQFDMIKAVQEVARGMGHTVAMEQMEPRH